jgi:hypothetical protein
VKPHERKRSVRRLAARILDAWTQATPEVVEAGRRWYRDARAWCLRVARETGLPVERVAGAVAALSPRCKWSINKRWARRVCRAWRDGLHCPRVSTRTFRRAAWGIVNGEAPADVLHGPKVWRFFLNLLGQCGPVTVDVWTARAAEGRAHKRRAPEGDRYERIEEAFQLVAHGLGRCARDVQATVWLAERGGALALS